MNSTLLHCLFEFRRFGEYNKLLTSSSLCIISFHYTDEWVSKNIDKDGNIVQWLKLGYKPVEK